MVLESARKFRFGPRGEIDAAAADIKSHFVRQNTLLSSPSTPFSHSPLRMPRGVLKDAAVPVPRFPMGENANITALREVCPPLTITIALKVERSSATRCPTSSTSAIHATKTRRAARPSTRDCILRIAMPRMGVLRTRPSSECSHLRMGHVRASRRLRSRSRPTPSAST